MITTLMRLIIGFKVMLWVAAIEVLLGLNGFRQFVCQIEEQSECATRT